MVKITRVDSSSILEDFFYSDTKLLPLADRNSLSQTLLWIEINKLNLKTSNIGTKGLHERVFLCDPSNCFRL